MYKDYLKRIYLITSDNVFLSKPYNVYIYRVVSTFFHLLDPPIPPKTTADYYIYIHRTVGHLYTHTPFAFIPHRINYI